MKVYQFNTVIFARILTDSRIGCEKFVQKQYNNNNMMAIIRQLSNSNETIPTRIGVLDVQRRGGAAVHTTDKPITVGQVVNASVDWERRFDHMQQHTGNVPTVLTTD